MDEKILDALMNNNSDVHLTDDLKERLTKILEKYQQLSDDEKEEFKNGAFDVLKKTLANISGSSFLPTWLVPYESYILFSFAVSVVFIPIALIARNLYQRVKDREERRGKKKKLKEQKAISKKKKKAN